MYFFSIVLNILQLQGNMLIPNQFMVSLEIPLRKKTTVIYVPRRYNCCCCLLFSYYIVSESFATPWTLAHQAPLCMGFPRQEYWSGLPSPSLGNVPNPETETSSPTLTGRFFTTEPSWKPQIIINVEKIHVSKTN